MKPRGRFRPLCGLALALAASTSPRASAASDVRVPGGAVPTVVEKLGAIDGAHALAIAPGARVAAVALPHPEESRRSLLRVVGAQDEAPREKTLPGVVRALLFPGKDLGLLVLLHRPSKKFDGETELLLLDPGSFDTLHEVRAPPSGMALESWSERGLVLVAAQDELRTFLLPELRSGPLYRVLGRNLAVAALGGSAFVVGQDTALLSLDLNDRQGVTELAPRERVVVPAAVSQLALDAGAQSGLVRLADGTVLQLQLDPLRTATSGSAAVVTSVPSETAPPVPPKLPAAAAPTMVSTPTPTPPPPPASAPKPPAPPASTSPSPSTAPPGTHATAPPGSSPQARPPGSPPPPGSTSAPRAPAVPPPGSSNAPPAAPAPAPGTAPAPAPGAAAPQAGTATLRGRIAGDSRDLVEAVIVLGPGNIVHEAQRVKPAADGSWEARGLAPGRYRVQLDGGPSRTLSTNPPFAVVELASGATAETPEFRIVGQW